GQAALLSSPPHLWTDTRHTHTLAADKAEACPSFYAVLGVLSLGSKTLLDTSLNLVNATEPEKVAMGKIQDCYNEAGVITKISDLIIMGTITTSPECISHALSTLTTDVQEGISKLNPLGR
uniref:Uncharacterized protein n=1 Tax=Equus caballus TaxID=9796 RepID=A0A9L0TU84_HORSE